MSFYSGFRLCRPTKPPVITGPALASFIEAFEALGLCAPDGFFYLNVKFGRAIDRNDNDTTIYTPVMPGVSQVTSINWDLEPENLAARREVIEHLRAHDRPVYRAEVGLGDMTDELCTYVNSTAGMDDEPNLHLDSWHLSIVPQHAGLLSTEGEFFTGWIGVGMDGPGYIFPLTQPDLVRRAEAHPGLAALTDLCRKTWPVTAAPVREPLWWYLPNKRKRHFYDMQGGRPSRRVRHARAAVGEAWPYPVDAPFDWHWIVHETG
jgi:hypothetical protein